MEELTDNAEEPDEGESKQSEVKLGKLQYKVGCHFSISSVLSRFIERRSPRHSWFKLFDKHPRTQVFEHLQNIYSLWIWRYINWTEDYL